MTNLIYFFSTKGTGGISLTLYLYKEHLKLKNYINELEFKVNCLTQQFEITEKTKVTAHKGRKLESTRSSRRSSYYSFHSDSDTFDTPSQSPSRTIKSVDFFLEHDNQLKKNNIIQEDFLSDNRSFDLLQMQTLENKRIIYENNRTAYEKVFSFKLFLFN